MIPFISTNWKGVHPGRFNCLLCCLNWKCILIKSFQAQMMFWWSVGFALGIFMEWNSNSYYAQASTGCMLHISQDFISISIHNRISSWNTNGIQSFHWVVFRLDLLKHWLHLGPLTIGVCLFQCIILILLKAYLKQITQLNQVMGMAQQLRNDISLKNHKYIAHQLALLYVR